MEQGLRKLQSDSAWTPFQLGRMQLTFPRLQTLDLQLCTQWNSVPVPLHEMTALQHLRLCKVNGLPPGDWKPTLARLKQLKTLALPWYANICRFQKNLLWTFQKLYLGHVRSLSGLVI